MIGILVLTHGTLGESLVEAAALVLNRRPPRLAALGIGAQQDPFSLLPQARALLAELDEGEGVLILADVYGGSPSNIAAKLLVPGRVEGVAGVSLPMLLRALTYRDRPLAALVAKAVSGGCEGVVRIPAPALSNAATGS